MNDSDDGLVRRLGTWMFEESGTPAQTDGRILMVDYGFALHALHCCFVKKDKKPARFPSVSHAHHD